MTGSWARLIKTIASSKRILIATHLDPDGDAVGAVLALNYLVRSHHRTPQVYCVDAVPDRYKFLKGSSLFQQAYRPYDLLIIADTANLKRITPDFEPLHNRIINIDHHKSNDITGIVRIVDGDSSSTCEIIYRLFVQNRFKITPYLAEVLYTGVFADTGGFTYANANQNALKTAQELVGHGAHPYHIARCVAMRSEAGVRLMGMVLSTLEVKQGIALSYLSQTMLDLTGARTSDSENFVSIPLGIEGIKVSILFREDENGKLRVSLRSDGEVDVDRIASQFGGGGHRTAAGLRTAKPLKEVKKKLLAAIRAMM